MATPALAPLRYSGTLERRRRSPGRLSAGRIKNTGRLVYINNTSSGRLSRTTPAGAAGPRAGRYATVADDDDLFDGGDEADAQTTAGTSDGGASSSSSSSAVRARRAVPQIKDLLRNPGKFVTDVSSVIPTGASRAIDEKVRDVVIPCNELEPTLRACTAEELRGKTDEFRRRLASGRETLDDILVEAFAVVREAAWRELNMRHFDVQLIGGALLHDGGICEMATGEGKTLTATLPAYLNALTGRGVHVVTVNDYLARRDAEWMGRVHRSLGLTVGVIQTDMEPEERRAAYDADITYVTNQEVGFDYLRDNMATEAKDLVMTRRVNFAIVDEVDSVLIDEGRNPLLITGPATEGDAELQKYTQAAAVAEQLKEGLDYTVDRKEKTADFTERGMMVAEQLLGVNDIWDSFDPWGRYLLLSVKAKALYLRDVHYIVRAGQVMIVDEGTGRVQANRRWNDNIHQAVEAKEGVEIKRENTTVASISYQCLFKLYDKLSGMTGTAKTEAEELFTTYKLNVITVPTHRPNLRIDKPHAMFRTANARWNAVADLVVSCHWEGRPVLVGTTSVEHSEYLSMLLDEYRWRSQDGQLVQGVPHRLLNARPQLAAREAEIVAQAGRAHAVTIATNMAGRGTDIVLGGNPSGLARLYLDRLLLPKLSAGTEEGDEALVENPMAHVVIRPQTKAAVDAAVGLAFLTAKADGAIPVLPESVQSLVSEAVEYAEQILRGGAVRVAAEKAAAEQEAAIGGPNPVVNGLRKAAVELLKDCNEQCEAEAALVREKGGLQVIGTALHDSRRIDNQLRGRAGRQGDPGSTIFCLSMEDELMAIYCPGWASSSVWDWSGMEDDVPLYSKVVDRQLETIQSNIEDFHATHRTSTYETDRIIDGQRDAIYNVRRKVLLDGQQPLRKRLIRYIEWVVDDACDAAKVNGNSSIEEWDIEGLLGDLRTVFASRKDQWRLESGRDMSDYPHFLPGVSAVDIKQSLIDKGAMPMQLRLPELEANPELVQAAIQGVEVVDMNPRSDPAKVTDTEPEAAEEEVAERVERRMYKPTGMESVEEYGRRGRNAGEARMLRTYLSESAIALYLDRFARLNQRYDRTDLEAVERIWVLRAIDERWQRHLVEMQVLRNSVNIRAFGQLDPMEEYRIDGARAFVDMVRDVRRKTLANVFFFVGSAVEPTLDFEEEERQAMTAAQVEAEMAEAAEARAAAAAAGVMPGRTSVVDFFEEGFDPESATEEERERVMVEVAKAAEKVMAQQRALIVEEEEIDGEGGEGKR